MSNLALVLVRPFLAETILVLGAIFILLLGVYKDNISPKIFSKISELVLLLSASILIFFPNIGHISEHFTRFFQYNEFVILAKIIIILASGLIISLHAGEESRNYEFVVLILFSVAGMMIMISASDFLSFYLGLELQSLCLFVLASYDREKSSSNEAGMKYFILSALASGLILYGISLFYGFGGSTNFTELALKIKSGIYQNIGVLVGLIFVIIGICFKISAAPFHIWAPDVYQGAPTIVTGFFISVPKIASILFFVSFLIGKFSVWHKAWDQILIFISLVSMFVGAFGALRQNNLKRLLAYSSVFHVGFIILGILGNDFLAVSAVLNYAIIYAPLTIGIFACILIARREEISDYAGLYKKKPVLACLLAILLFSMAGIPPFAGFWAKFTVLNAAIKSNYLSLSVVALLASVISAYYYLKIIKTMFFDEDLSNKLEQESVSNSNSMLIAWLMTIFNIIYIFISEGFMLVINHAAASILKW